MKTLSLGLCATFLLASTTLAADSEWLLGDNGKIAVTMLEHRDDTGMGREADITLILGTNFLHGKLHNADSGTVTLKADGPAKYAYTYTGTFGVSYETKKIKLKGMLKIPGEADTKIDTIIAAKVLTGLE